MVPVNPNELTAAQPEATAGPTSVLRTKGADVPEELEKRSRTRGLRPRSCPLPDVTAEQRSRCAQQIPSRAADGSQCPTLAFEETTASGAVWPRAVWAEAKAPAVQVLLVLRLEACAREGSAMLEF